MDTESQKILSDLIETAINGTPLTFELVTSLSEYFYLRSYRRSLKATIKVLRSCTKHLLKSYCEEIKVQQQQLTKLLAIETLSNTLEFYEKDYDTVDAMLCEYEIYLMCTCFADIWLFRKRPERNLWNYRRYLG